MSFALCRAESEAGFLEPSSFPEGSTLLFWSPPRIVIIFGDSALSSSDELRPRISDYSGFDLGAQWASFLETSWVVIGGEFSTGLNLERFFIV
jgi:hypothetical protein